MNKNKKSHWTVCTLFVAIVCISLKASETQEEAPLDVAVASVTKKLPNDAWSKFKPATVRRYMFKLFLDMGNITKNLASFDSLKVLTGTLPFYLIARQADAKLHDQFYDADLHENIHQPTILKKLLDAEMMAVPLIGYGIFAWIDKSPYKRRAAQLFTAGLLCSVASKMLLKEIFRGEAGLRPLNGDFDSDGRVHGGLPSGHVTEAAFAAMYLGMSKGPKYAVPLGLYAGLVASLSIVNNNHYFSQVIAGAGLGVGIGLAAYRVLDGFEVHKDFELGLASDKKGGLGIKIAYNF